MKTPVITAKRKTAKERQMQQNSWEYEYEYLYNIEYSQLNFFHPGNRELHFCT
jgi:hypothetical protein